MTDQYISGNWRVRAGYEDEFVRRWTELTGWAMAHAPGVKSFVLLREADDHRHFVSFGTWTDRAAANAWRSTQEFARHLGRCRELCEDFHGADYVAAASPTLVR